ncbi:unnamed protein product [Chironomus riparius]|uniref:EGF-like domain-containing protein n=1 Tax=Chironomus riparius TaxID=315576 RepID=A0A9N9RZV6_9DIPT|nr:unnamed protein product [Chironomus riparius]
MQSKVFFLVCCVLLCTVSAQILFADTPECSHLECGPKAVCKVSNFGYACKCKSEFGGPYSMACFG